MMQDFIRPVLLQLMTETWWPALRCLSQISHTLFNLPISKFIYESFAGLRIHAPALVEVFSNNFIFRLPNVAKLDEAMFICGAKLWSAIILKSALIEKPLNTDYETLNVHHPIS